jgi:hypothetical protein
MDNDAANYYNQIIRERSEALRRVTLLEAENRTLKNGIANESVLQDWVMKLPLRAQGTLLTGVRGCDTAPKTPDQGLSTERQLIGFLRFCTLNPADIREVGIPGAFFQPEPPVKWKASEFGHYPQHWYAHCMHCFEVVGYCHPSQNIQGKALIIYYKLVHNLHLEPEPQDRMLERLTEDRMITNTVVS